LVICEQTGQWATAIRRAVGGRRIRVSEARGLQLCREVIDEFPASFVVYELRPDNGDALLRHLGEIWISFPQAATAVVASRGLQNWSWPMREAGALWFGDSPRYLNPLVRMAQRHLVRHACATPSWRELIWQRWGLST
jgi:hypothetical protein